MRRGDEWQQLPDNPERFDKYASVLGSEGFNSGTHCWDVEVGDNRDWNVGIMRELAGRKGDMGKLRGLWLVCYNHGKYSAISYSWLNSFWLFGTMPCFPIKVEQKPQRIRVLLDWDSRELSFTDPDKKRKTVNVRLWCLQ